MTDLRPSDAAPERTGPLAGVKVLDLSIAATGPYACTLLADQGADVIKVERPGFGDIGRYVGVARAFAADRPPHRYPCPARA